MDKCHICTRSILSHSKIVTCCSCSMKFHLKCISLSSEDINYIKDNQQTWFCSLCITELFPSNHIEDDVEFVSTIDDITVSGSSMCYLSEKVFIPFELNDRDHPHCCVILGPVSLRLMTSQFKDIVTHTQKYKTVKCTFCGVWVPNFVWNFKGALWNFTQNFEPIHRKMCILRGGKKWRLMIS